MIVLDVECTGVSVSRASLLSIGAVDYENPTNRFYGECRAFEGAEVEGEALQVNGFTREQAFDPAKPTQEVLIAAFLAWAAPLPDLTLAGMNPHFDRGFLLAACERARLVWPFGHRLIDLHSIAYARVARDQAVPLRERVSALNSEAIQAYVGLPKEAEPHNGLNGALIEAEAFSRLMRGRGLLEEFAGYQLPPTLAS